MKRACTEKIHVVSSWKHINQICGMLFRYEKRLCRKIHAVSSRKRINQIRRKPFRHEKSWCRKISCRFVAKAHKPNLQDAVSSWKELMQKNFMSFRRESAWTKIVWTMIRMILGLLWFSFNQSNHLISQIKVSTFGTNKKTTTTEIDVWQNCLRFTIRNSVRTYHKINRLSEKFAWAMIRMISGLPWFSFNQIIKANRTCVSGHQPHARQFLRNSQNRPRKRKVAAGIKD
jgi:hypothetical protein